MHKRLIILFCLLIPTLFAEVSIIEIPLRIQNVYMRRLPGVTQFCYAARLPGNGRLIAIPESEIARFLALADTEGFTDDKPGTYAFLPKQTAIGEVANATITIEHTGDFRFFVDQYGIWITWDEDHPAPVDTVNGVPIVAWEKWERPHAPGAISAD